MCKFLAWAIYTQEFHLQAIIILFHPLKFFLVKLPKLKKR